MGEEKRSSVSTEKDKKRNIKMIMIKKHINHALEDSWTFIEYIKGVSILIVSLGFSFMLVMSGFKILFL